MFHYEWANYLVQFSIFFSIDTIITIISTGKRPAPDSGRSPGGGRRDPCLTVGPVTRPARLCLAGDG